MARSACVRCRYCKSLLYCIQKPYANNDAAARKIQCARFFLASSKIFRDILSANAMKAKIIVTPKKAVVDPQGKTVQVALEQMGHRGIRAVHVGKYLEI